jgi:hypothetical protein
MLSEPLVVNVGASSASLTFSVMFWVCVFAPSLASTVTVRLVELS